MPNKASPNTGTGAALKDRKQLREPDLYDVVLLNDDFTTMEFVVMVLVKVFFKSASEAMALMLAVHHEGEAVAGTYTLDIARSKADRAIEMARAEGFPLMLKIRKKQ